MLHIEKIGYKLDSKLTNNSRIVFQKEYNTIKFSSYTIYIYPLDKKIKKALVCLHSVISNVYIEYDEMKAVIEIFDSYDKGELNVN